MQSWRRTFLTIWIGQAISILTSSVLQMSIVWYITQETGSAALLSLSTLIGFLPQAVLGLFSGVFIDRYDRKRIMIFSDIGIALAGMVLVIWGFFGQIPIWLIFIVLFLRAIGSAFHSPSLNAITPLLVPQEQLTKYAGYSQGFKSFSMLVSPALAAVLFSIWELNVIILMDVIGALIAVGILCFVRIPKVQKNPHAEKPHIIREAKEGIRILREEPGMLSLLVISILYAFIYFPIGTLYPHITMTYFGGSVSQSGFVEVVYSSGMLLGSFLLGIIGGKIRKMGAIVKSIFVYGTGVLIIGFLPPAGFPVFIVLSAVMGIANPFFQGVQVAIYQSRIKEEYLGRVLSLTSSLGMLAMPLGLILSGTFAGAVGVNIWFRILGVCAVLLAITASFLPAFRQNAGVNT